MEKLIFHLRSDGASGRHPEGDELWRKRKLWEINAELHAALKDSKDLIDDFHKTNFWDTFKKLSNTYETVNTSPIYTPVSRSFFKLWEMMQDFSDTLSTNEPMTVAFLAEGPGGFIEAFWKFRSHPSRDHIHTITLRSADKRVPQLRLLREMHGHVHVSYGADGTGDLYLLHNVEHFVRQMGGEATCNLVCADAGFDFSGDFNNQELMSLRLLCAEVYTAFRLQRPGGAFVLKVFDIFCPETMGLIQCILDAYNDVYIVKPLTSRPANSEKYLVCTGFTGASREVIDKLEHCMLTGEFLVPDVAIHLMSQLIEFNVSSVTRQILYIIKTIVCIDNNASHPDLLQHLSKLHSDASRRWCTEYGEMPARH